MSDDLIEECSKRGVAAKNLVLVENAIDAADFRRRRTIREAKEAIGLPQTRFLIGAVGRLSDEKGFDVLIPRCIPSFNKRKMCILSSWGKEVKGQP